MNSVVMAGAGRVDIFGGSLYRRLRKSRWTSTLAQQLIVDYFVDLMAFLASQKETRRGR